jgi:hypothetical protein
MADEPDAPPSDTETNGSAGPERALSGPLVPDHGRQPNGQFGKGNQAARGHTNKTYRLRARLRRAALADATPGRVRALMARLREQAMAGDLAAARTWLSYTVGRPAPMADGDDDDLHEWALLLRGPTSAEATSVAYDGLPVRQVVAYVASVLCGADVRERTVGEDPPEEHHLEEARQRRARRTPPGP